MEAAGVMWYWGRETGEWFLIFFPTMLNLALALFVVHKPQQNPGWCLQRHSNQMTSEIPSDRVTGAVLSRLFGDLAGNTQSWGWFEMGGLAEEWGDRHIPVCYCQSLGPSYSSLISRPAASAAPAAPGYWLEIHGPSAASWIKQRILTRAQETQKSSRC